MTAWLNLGLGALIIFNLAIAATSFRSLRRLRRELAHLRVLDMLLGSLAARSFADAHIPFWQAWGASMGAIRLEVGTEIKRWTWDVAPDGKPLNVECRKEDR